MACGVFVCASVGSTQSLQRAGEESLGTEEDLYSDRDERVAVQLPEMVRSSSLDAIDLFGSGPGGGVSRPFYAIELNDLQINHMDDRSLDGEEDVQSRMSVGSVWAYHVLLGEWIDPFVCYLCGGMGHWEEVEMLN